MSDFNSLGELFSHLEKGEKVKFKELPENIQKHIQQRVE